MCVSLFPWLNMTELFVGDCAWGQVLTSREVEREVLQIQLLIRWQEHTEDDSVQLKHTHTMTFIRSICSNCEFISCRRERSVWHWAGNISKMQLMLQSIIPPLAPHYDHATTESLVHSTLPTQHQTKCVCVGQIQPERGALSVPFTSVGVCMWT